MPTLKDLVPDADTLIALDPEELGALLLGALIDRRENGGMIHPGNFEGELFGQGRMMYPVERQDAVLEAVREAFAWLEGQALLIAPDSMNAKAGWRRLGRRGRRMATAHGFQAYREASTLPKQILHPRIRDNVFFNFQRGDYQTAVFLAFREVEIYVREKSGIDDEVGVKLMRKAFDKDKGPMRDATAEEGEREARAHLFAGAIGSYKNPHSHKSVDLSAKDAVEMLVLASHLLRVADTLNARSAALDDESYEWHPHRFQPP